MQTIESRSPTSAAGEGGLLRELIELHSESGIEIRAVCDTWRQKLERATASTTEATGKAPLQSPYYQEFLERDDIDAVLIATPDHQHCTMLVDSIRAGKTRLRRETTGNEFGRAHLGLRCRERL
ncbi:MAG TPA: Gfo/Idh/MocA family oxidoreductase [Acidobacteriota bacterium]|nr:Gfo/Idh/MocA family oxidoreductase [Acidobacteriota bacterium]